MIKTIRSEVLSGQKSDAGPKAQIGEILAREGYEYRPFADGAFDEPIAMLEQQMQAAQVARVSLESDLHHLDQDIATTLQIDPAGITQVRVLPISISAELDGTTYNEFDEKLTGNKNDTAYSAGMVDTRWKLGPLSVTIARQGRSNAKTPEHEDLHVQYQLLHPSYTRSRQSSEKVSLGQQATQLEETIALRDYNSFTDYVEGNCRYWLRNYLDELSAGAITKRTDAYDGSFSDVRHIYYQGFQRTQQYMRDRFPDDIASRLQFEGILYEEVKRTEYRARLIQDAYNELSKTHDEPDLIAICNFLTIYQGYLINAFKETGGLIWKNRRQLRKWRTDYEDGGRTKVTSKEVIDLLLKVSTEEYVEKSADGATLPPFEDELSYIQAQFKQRLTRLMTYFDDPEYEKMLNLIHLTTQGERIKEEVLVGVVDFARHYAAQYDHLFRKIQTEVVDPTVYESLREEVVDRMKVLAKIGRKVYQGSKGGKAVDGLFTNTEKVPENTAHIADILQNGWHQALLHDSFLLGPDISLIRRIIYNQQALISNTKDPETGNTRWQWLAIDPESRQLRDMIYAQSQSDGEQSHAWEGLLMLSLQSASPNIFDWWIKRKGPSQDTTISMLNADHVQELREDLRAKSSKNDQ